MKTTQYLNDILTAIKKIRKYAPESFNKLLENEMALDGILYMIIQLGEAANRLDIGFRDNNPQIPWQKIIGTRNLIAHGYDYVSAKVVWGIIETDLNSLEEEITKLL